LFLFLYEGLDGGGRKELGTEGGLFFKMDRRLL